MPSDDLAACALPKREHAGDCGRRASAGDAQETISAFMPDDAR
jgi:hypothetical protein